jgi:murein DD-endopeptidase MepM/ murein hydrolase activator NlpD
VNDRTKNRWPRWCQSNTILIRHQDGDYSTYAHMPPNGSFVVAGQRVFRGQDIGLSGNTT